jgi:hypothetical protein
VLSERVLKRVRKGRLRRGYRRKAWITGIGGLILLSMMGPQLGQCASSEAAGFDTGSTQGLAAGSGTTGYYEAAIQGGPVARDCAPAAVPTVRANQSLNGLFDNQIGPGWLGGDATYSTALPNGKEGFVFGDTIVGTAESSGRVTSFQGMVHDSELVGTMAGLESNLGGTTSSPTALIPDTNANDGWQIGATYMEHGQQLIFLNEGTPVPGSIYGTYTGRSAIAVMSLDSGTPEFSSLVNVPTDAWTQWGNAVVQSGGYNYIYGVDFNTATGTWYGLKVSRAPVGESLDLSAWRYWNGSSWVSGESQAVVTTTPLVNGVIPLKGASGFMGIGIGGSGSNQWVALTFSCSPTGPWSRPVTVYSIPETTAYSHEIAYMANFHPELGSKDLVASYSIDSALGLSSVLSNDHEYQPRFIQIEASGADALDVQVPDQLPETPMAVAAPLAALILFGGTLLFSRRRRTTKRA